MEAASADGGRARAHVRAWLHGVLLWRARCRCSFWRCMGTPLVLVLAVLLRLAGAAVPGSASEVARVRCPTAPALGKY